MKILSKLAFVLLLLIHGPAIAADAGRISAVVLYPGAATIERTAKVAAGATRVELAGLPAIFDPQSLRVEADSGIDVSEVAIRDEGKAQGVGGREAELEAKIQALVDQKAALDVDAKSADLVREYLSRLSGAPAERGEKPQAPALDPHALTAIIEVINRSGSDAFGRLQRVEVQKRELDKQIAALQRDLVKVRSGAKDVRSIVIHLTARRPGELRVAYQVRGAGWRPVYRASLDSAASRVEIERNAVVTQTTGEDWSGVKIRLATVQPRLTPQGREPAPWTVAIRPDRTPASSPAMRGGQLQSMSEAADSVSARTITEIQSTFATEFDVGGTVDVPSDGRQVTLHLAKEQLAVKQLFRIVPRTEPAAFVTAEAERPEGIWPAGNMQLFRDGSFVGATHWNAHASDQLRLPFGRDDRIRVVLGRVRDRSGDGGFLGNRSEREVGYLYTIHSSHKSAIELLLLDTAPVSTADAIEVRTAFEPKPTEANWDNKQGIHAWKHTLQPGATLKIEAGYTISYPKDVAVVGLP